MAVLLRCEAWVCNLLLIVKSRHLDWLSHMKGSPCSRVHSQGRLKGTPRKSLGWVLQVQKFSEQSPTHPGHRRLCVSAASH